MVWDVKTTTVYDAEGRVFQVIMNDVDTVEDTTKEDLTFEFAYDAEGVRTQVTYPSGAVRVFADDLGAGPDDEFRLRRFRPARACHRAGQRLELAIQRGGPEDARHQRGPLRRGGISIWPFA